MARMAKVFRRTQLQQPTLYGSTTPIRRRQPLHTLGLLRNWTTRQTGSGEVTASLTYPVSPFTVLLVAQICSSYMFPLSLLVSWHFLNQMGMSIDPGRMGAAPLYKAALSQQRSLDS